MTLFENEDELNNTHSDYALIIKNNRDNISVIPAPYSEVAFYLWAIKIIRELNMQMKKFRLALLASSIAFSTSLWAQAIEVPATLAGHAVLPVKSTVAAPADAPTDLQQSGKYTSGQRVSTLGAVAGKLTLPGAPDGKQNFQVARSKGFEGMAVSPDGSKLYPMLEGALWNGEKFESIDGKRYLHVLEFDVKNQAWTGRSWQYVLEDNQNAIGDFNMIDAKHGLVIERDNGEGTADRACAAGAATDKCFSQIAKFKRVYKIAFSDENVGKPVEKVSYIDLLNIKDPQNLARKPLNNGVLTFPFFTIENVDVVDANHIIVGNDNNFPLSSNRQPNEADE